jgi:hypothetical protein
MVRKRTEEDKKRNPKTIEEMRKYGVPMKKRPGWDRMGW